MSREFLRTAAAAKRGRSLGRLMGRIPMTWAIVGMAIAGILAAGLAMGVALYFNLAAKVKEDAAAALQAGTRGAVTVLAGNMPDVSVTWDQNHELAVLGMPRIPAFDRHDLIDLAGTVTHDAVTLFSFDAATGAFRRETTTLRDASGARAVGTLLDTTTPAYAALRSGKPFSGEVGILGVDHYTHYQPIVGPDGKVVGALLVAIPNTQIDRSLTEILRLLAVVGGMVTVALGLVSLLLSRAMVRPIPVLVAVMTRIAGGELDTAVPYLDRGNEIGVMARAIEIFRANADRIVQMGREKVEAEAARAAERARTMQTLKSEFLEVVSAGVGGDFSRQVASGFDDPELNELAEGINALVRTVDAGLEATGEVLHALANTDLTRRVEGQFGGAFATLQADTNAVADRLTGVVGELREASRAVRTATSEILAGANDLSERTTKQAAAIEQTSSAMEQLASTVVDNARKAELASRKAADVFTSTEASGAVMSETTGAMERISSSSDRISNVIGMIDDIAFQTNLLALNASVEAARAGDAGKGFAVVAVEVRRLAQSAAESSAEVKALVNESFVNVQQGSRLVSDAAERLRAVLTEVRESSTLIGEIAAASQEQASAIEEVNVAIRQMDEMTQHNAALVEETNAAIEQTETQAFRLDTIVDTFVIEDRAAAIEASVKAHRKIAGPTGRASARVAVAGR